MYVYMAETDKNNFMKALFVLVKFQLISNWISQCLHGLFCYELNAEMQVGFSSQVCEINSKLYENHYLQTTDIGYLIKFVTVLVSL